MIISFEGIDGAGKSTAAINLSAELNERRIANVVIGGASFTESERRGSAPDRDAAGDGVRSWTLSADERTLRRMWEYRDDLEEEFGPRALCLSNAWEFAYRWESLAVPALESGKVIIADRYIDTALVRDVLRGIPEDYVRSIYAFVPPSDMVIYVDTEPETAYRRKTIARLPIGYFEAGQDLTPRASLHTSFVAFQSKCRKRYEEILKGERVVRVDGNRKPAEVQAEILAAVVGRLENRLPGSARKSGAAAKLPAPATASARRTKSPRTNADAKGRSARH